MPGNAANRSERTGKYAVSMERLNEFRRAGAELLPDMRRKHCWVMEGWKKP